MFPCLNISKIIFFLNNNLPKFSFMIINTTKIKFYLFKLKIVQCKNKIK